MSTFAENKGGDVFDTGDTVNAMRSGRASRQTTQMVVGSGDAADRCALDPKPDGPRYAACGDAVSVPVAEWIGSRLMDRYPDLKTAA